MILQAQELKILQTKSINIVNDSFVVLGDQLAELLLLTELKYANNRNENVAKLIEFLNCYSEDLDEILNNSRIEMLVKTNNSMFNRCNKAK